MICTRWREFCERARIDARGARSIIRRCGRLPPPSTAAGLSPRSIQRRLSAARTFYEFLMREGHCARNPAQDVRAPKTKKRLPATLDADQMGRLLAFRVDGYAVRPRQGHHGIVLFLRAALDRTRRA